MLLDVVRAFLRELEAQRPFLFPLSGVVVGVSGGPDSLALLHALHQCLKPGQLVVAHLNHGLRPAAAGDTDFVKRTAAAWQLRCHVEQVDVRALAAGSGQTLEEAGRQARYRFFARVAHETGAPVVATGHHADDQVETVLLHLLRGTGLAGLRGMEPVSQVPDATGLWLIRPLLDVTRATIEAYCSTHELHPVQDSTNQELTYSRNRIRHELLPFLAKYNPRIKENISQLAAIAAADEALLATLTQTYWTQLVKEEQEKSVLLDRQRWRALPLGLQRRILRRAVQHLVPALQDVGYRTLEQARRVASSGRTGAVSELPDGVQLRLTYDGIWMSRGAVPPSPDAPQLATAEAGLTLPGYLALQNGWVIEAEEIMIVGAVFDPNGDRWQVSVDVGDAESLTVRGRLPGERFQPFGLQGHSATVKEVMINRKIPLAQRARWPLVTNKEHLVWLVGHRIDERVRVTVASRRVVRLRCYRGDV